MTVGTTGRPGTAPEAEAAPASTPVPHSRMRRAVTRTVVHRVVDGAPAARFLADLRNRLEEPGWMAAGTHTTARTQEPRP